MSDQTSILQENTETTVETTPSALTSILNEKGEPKYKSVDDALNALVHSQKFIPQLQEENSALKAQLEKLIQERNDLMNIESTLADLVNKQEDTGNTNQQTQSEQVDMEELVRQQIKAYEESKKQEQNKLTVAKSLQETFGEKAQEVFSSKAQELGISPQELEALAMKSPALVLNALGVSETVAHKQTNVAPPAGNVNTAAMGETPASVIGTNTQPFLSGATSRSIKDEVERAKQMAAELQEKGLSAAYYADPRNFFRDF